MTPFHRRFIALTVAILLSPTPDALQSAAIQQTQPTFKSGTTVVEVDVSVRDGQRRFVADLQAGDFEVLEDGARQEISAVYRVVGPNEAAAGEAAAATAASNTTLLPPPTASQQVQRVVVFFFDHAHMSPGSLDRAKRAAAGFLEKSFRPGDVGGVLSGPAMVNNRLTSRREELEAAIAAVKPTADPSSLVRELRQWPRFVDVLEAFRVVRNEPAYGPGGSTALEAVASRACRDQPDQCSGGRGGAGAAAVEGLVQNKATQVVEFARTTGKQTIDTVAALANGLARVPGRKTLIMLSDGFFAEDSWADLRGVVGRAARASLRIYAIDTRGLNRGSAGSDVLTTANPSQPELAVPSIGDTNSDAPNSLAVDTGGYVVRNENDFGKAFTEIDRDTSSYYIVGFRTRKPLDGRYHPVTVRVNRAGVTVRARKGYIASPVGSGNPAVATTPSPGETVARSAAPPSPPAPAEAPLLVARPRPPVAKAVESLESAPPRRAAPASVTKAARAGWEAYQRGDLKAAREALRPLASEGTAPPWARYVLGWCEYASSAYPEATREWEQVREEVPQFQAVYFDLADGYLQQREFGKAIAVLRDAQRRWPNEVDSYNALGVVQAGRGALNEAIKTFEEAVGLAPTDATANYNLAKTLELRFVQSQRLRRLSSQDASAAMPDRERALEYYRRVVQIGGSNVEAAREGIKRLSGGA